MRFAMETARFKMIQCEKAFDVHVSKSVEQKIFFRFNYIKFPDAYPANSDDANHSGYRINHDTARNSFNSFENKNTHIQNKPM